MKSNFSFLRVVFVCLAFHLYGFSDWMLEQIQEDLLPFQKQSIQRNELFQEMKKPYAKQHGFLLIEIINNQISWISDPCYHEHERLKAVLSFFERLTAHNPLPNVAFLISLGDSYEDTGPFALQMSNTPVFTFAKRTGARSILFPDFEALHHSNELIANCNQFATHHPWKNKNSFIFWRGSSTGAMLTEENYLDVPRVKLVHLSKLSLPWLDASFTHLCQATEAVLHKLQNYQKPPVPIQDHFPYKYLIDVDGNSCTYSRCRWILLSNSTLIKQESKNIQWYYKALKPYKHYVPCKGDLSDLSSLYNWLKTHDQEAHQIAKNGKKLGRKIFCQDAIDLYVIKLLEEYAKLYAPFSKHADHN